MEKQKKYLGYWWIVNPSDQYYNNKNFSGTLSINENNKISLVLMVDFEMQLTNDSKFLVINGIMDNTEEGNCATLLNCKMQNSSFRFGCASVSLIEYTCDFLL